MFSINLAGTVCCFFLFLQQHWLQIARVDQRLLFFLRHFSYMQLKVKQIFFFSHGTVEMWQRESRLCWHPHSLSYATLQKLKQLFMASLGVVYWTEHLELVTPKTLRACIKYGKLGSMQNFQMGKSSSMCSWERDVNSIPEKVNDAQT